MSAFLVPKIFLVDASSGIADGFELDVSAVDGHSDEHFGFWRATPCSPDSLKAHKGPDPRRISLMPTHPGHIGVVGSRYAFYQHGFMGRSPLL